MGRINFQEMSMQKTIGGNYPMDQRILDGGGDDNYSLD
jgi:hypothetical protein